jgi:lysine 2,3-aminomutase
VAGPRCGRDDPHCPIRRQVIPTDPELLHLPTEQLDPLAEDRDSPVPGLLRRYPDRVAMIVTSECASYCRFCTRSRLVGKPVDLSGRLGLEAAFQYIEAHSQVRDVLFTGGDPLVLSDNFLEDLLSRVRRIRHVEVVRISTRVPIFLPQRITSGLCAILSRHHPVWINVNCNHPRELSAEACSALTQLADAGVPLESQSVLMASVNDCPYVIRELVHKLVAARVRPYYLYQCDPVYGTHQFRTPLAKGLEIIEGLRGHTSGYCVPTFVVDAPAGGGKVPLSPNYIVSAGSARTILRNCEGKLFAYDEPPRYEEHSLEACPHCRNVAMPRTPSVSSLLETRPL